MRHLFYVTNVNGVLWAQHTHGLIPTYSGETLEQLVEGIKKHYNNFVLKQGNVTLGEYFFEQRRAPLSPKQKTQNVETSNARVCYLNALIAMSGGLKSFSF